MTVHDYLGGELIIILLVTVPCVGIYIIASLLMKIAANYDDAHAPESKSKRRYLSGRYR